ncbi:MAG: hypothetical protein AB4368_04955 [Xenococcaceae cyanobacterium]
MKPQKINDTKMHELNKALEFAQEIDKKIQDFNASSAKVANKWQKKVENQVKKINN